MKKLFTELAEEFVSHRDIADNSRRLYSRVLHLFGLWVAKRGLDIKTLSENDMLEYKRYLQPPAEYAERKQASTVNSYLTVLRTFFAWLAERGEHTNIMERVKIPSPGRHGRKKALTREEAEKLLSSIPRDTEIGQRDYAIVNLLLRTGMRCIEASRLRIDDIEEKDGGYILSLQRKGNKYRTDHQRTHRKAVAPVLQYLEVRRRSCYSGHVFMPVTGRFPTPLSSLRISRIVISRMQEAGVYDSTKTAHSLRHTAAVMALRSGSEPRDVQAMLGHHNFETTERYLKSIDGEISFENKANFLLNEWL